MYTLVFPIFGFVNFQQPSLHNMSIVGFIFTIELTKASLGLGTSLLLILNVIKSIKGTISSFDIPI